MIFICKIPLKLEGRGVHVILALEKKVLRDSLSLFGGF